MTVEIISRTAWGAKPPKMRTPIVWPDGVTLWVHHSDGPNLPVNASEATEAATVRAIQAFHQGPSRGWNDIGYGYLAAPSGRIYEGRGEAIAAHCPGHNHEPSVCLLGTFATVSPSPAQHRAVYQLANMLNAGDLAGHREGFATSCPGDAAMRLIVNGPPPAGFGEDFDPVAEPITFRQRMIRAGYGPKSVDTIVARLAAGYVGDIPRPTDRATMRRLRDAGFGVVSARRIVRAGRAKRRP